MKYFFSHLFLPHHTNNHRPAILHNISILLLIVGIVTLSSLSLFTKHNHPAVLGISYSISDTEMLNEVNAVRVQHGLSPLTLNSELSSAAAGKAANMFQNDYWAHFGPDGTTPWQFIRGAGYDYLDAGENLAKGFTSSHDVVDAWMNSETHRANILSPKYHDIGFAISPGILQGEDTVLVVQMFGSRLTEPTVEKTNTVAIQTVPAESINLASPAAIEHITVTVTPAPIIAAQENQEPLVMSSTSNVHTNPAINISLFSKSFVLILFVVLLVVFVLDLLIIERRKVPRIVGHNIDHIILITLFIVFVLLFKNGFVL